MASPSVRASARWLWGAAIALLALRIALGFYESRFPPKLPDLVHWVPVADAERLAQDTQKPILYVFSASWCEPCKQMRWEVFADADSAEQINRDFVPVYALEGGEAGLSTEAEVEELTRKYGVGSYPTLVVVSSDHPPAMARGYSGKSAVGEFLASGWRGANTFGLAPTLKGFEIEIDKQKARFLDGGLPDSGPR